jgi:hypothetical protein
MSQRYQCFRDKSKFLLTDLTISNYDWLARLTLFSICIRALWQVAVEASRGRDRKEIAIESAANKAATYVDGTGRTRAGVGDPEGESRPLEHLGTWLTSIRQFAGSGVTLRLLLLAV